MSVKVTKTLSYLFLASQTYVFPSISDTYLQCMKIITLSWLICGQYEHVSVIRDVRVKVKVVWLSPNAAKGSLVKGVCPQENFENFTLIYEMLFGGMFGL